MTTLYRITEGTDEMNSRDEEVFPKPCRLIWQGTNDPNAPEHVPPEFNLDDEALMHDIFGPDLQDVGTELLVAIRQLEWTEGSFGVNDKAAAFDYLRPYLKDFINRCRRIAEEM